MKSRFKRLVSKLRGFFPEKLPTGIQDYEKFMKSIFEDYSIPEESSYTNAVATMIMHLDPTTDKKSRYYFAKSIRKAQANQIAYHFIMKIRDDNKKQELEAAPPKSEPPIVETVNPASEDMVSKA